MDDLLLASRALYSGLVPWVFAVGERAGLLFRFNPFGPELACFGCSVRQQIIFAIKRYYLVLGHLGIDTYGIFTQYLGAYTFTA